MALTVVATNRDWLQDVLGTTALTPNRWPASFGLGMAVFLVVEAEKWIRHQRNRGSGDEAPAPDAVVAPKRALAGATSS